MARRRLLTEEERRQLFSVPTDHDVLARHYSLTRAELDLVFTRRGAANRLGFAVQLVLLRQHGLALSQMVGSVKPLVDWMAGVLDISAARFADYARRHQTMTDHAREAASILAMRPSSASDIALMIEAAAQAAWPTDQGWSIVTGMLASLRREGILPPAPAVIERIAIAGRARARRRMMEALLAGMGEDQVLALDGLLEANADAGAPSDEQARLAWIKDIPVSPKADHVRELIDKLHLVRSIGLNPGVATRIPEDRFRQLVREAMASPAYRLARYTTARRRATLVALLIDLETRLIDAVLDMADRLIGGAFTRAKHKRERTIAVATKDIGRLMRLFHGTIEALRQAQEHDGDAFAIVDAAVGWAKLLRVRTEVEDLATLAEEDPLVRAADRYTTFRRFAPALLKAIEFRAARPNDPLLAAVTLLRTLDRSSSRTVPADAPMPFRREWRLLVMQDGRPDRRLYETAVLATLRNRLRSGDVWVERSSGYRRFDSYLLPAPAVPAVTSSLGLPPTAEEWLRTRGERLDRRLNDLALRLHRGQLEGVELRDGRLHITPLKAATPPDAMVLADRLDGMLPRIRITELLHEVHRHTGFAQAFTNLRTGDLCDNLNALFAAILADGTNLGIGRMAQASQGVTRDQLLWTAEAYIRPETYQAALARIINAHHDLPISSVWGRGTSSASDGQFFRSGKRGNAAGELNARHGSERGFSFYTHVSDQNGPYHIGVISATAHEAPYVLDGLLHHGSNLRIDTHYVDTGGASDPVFALCAMLGFHFRPRLRDFPDRRLATLAPPGSYPDLAPLLGRRIQTDVIREHWPDVMRLVASLKTGTVAPSVMLRKLAAYDRQNQLDRALQELGRIERTLFMIDWLESPDLRRQCQIGLNKGEQRHALAQAICTFKQGRIADQSPAAQLYRASGLNLLIAAIVYWNSTYLADAVEHLRNDGDLVRDEYLAHTSPLSWEHISLSGDFLWEQAALVPSSRRPLNIIMKRRAA